MRRAALVLLAALLAGCASAPAPDAGDARSDATRGVEAPDEWEDARPPPAPADDEALWDMASPLPRFVTASPLDPAEVARVSRFRSAVGHDFSDAIESCRSMKHYFAPIGAPIPGGHDPSWATRVVRSPVNGTIVRLLPEWTGVQVHLRPDGWPAFSVRLFHVAIAPGIEVGARVIAGAPIGNHSSDRTMSDAAVEVRTDHGLRFVSLFHVMDDRAFAAWEARGVPFRDALVLARAERDAAPLSCDGERFLTASDARDWIVLGGASNDTES